MYVETYTFEVPETVLVQHHSLSTKSYCTLLWANHFLNTNLTCFGSPLCHLQGLLDCFCKKSKWQNHLLILRSQFLPNIHTLYNSWELYIVMHWNIKLWILCKHCDLRINNCLCNFDVSQKRQEDWRWRRGTPKHFGIVVQKWLAYKKCALNVGK